MLKKTWMAKTKKAELGPDSKLGAMPKLDLFLVQSKLLLKSRETWIKQKNKAKISFNYIKKK